MAVIQIEAIDTSYPEGSAIGLITLRHYYAIFDMDNTQVGFVP